MNTRRTEAQLLASYEAKAAKIRKKQEARTARKNSALVRKIETAARALNALYELCPSERVEAVLSDAHATIQEWLNAERAAANSKDGAP